MVDTTRQACEQSNQFYLLALVESSPCLAEEECCVDFVECDPLSGQQLNFEKNECEPITEVTCLNFDHFYNQVEKKCETR